MTHISTRRSRGRHAARALWTLGFLVFAAHAAYNVLGVGRGTFDAIVSPWTPFLVFVACAAVSFAGGLSHPRERAAWWALSVGLLLYALGQPYFVLVLANQPPPGFPSGADLLWLSLSPFALAAIVLLVRAQGARTRELWLDGAIAGLATASLAVLVIFELVIDPAAALHAAPANMAFALADALVVGFGVAACGALGWRPPRSLVVLIIGYAAQALQDTWYLSALVRGTLTPGTFLDSCWLLGLLLIAAAAWPRPAPAIARQPSRRALVAFPFVFALAAVALTSYQALAGSGISAVPVALSTSALIAVVVRFALTFRAQLTMIAALEQAQADRAQLLAQTVRAGEQERIRIAAELHDGPVQHLASLGYVLDRAGRRLRRGDPDTGLAYVERARSELTSQVAGLRHLMSQLRPPVLDEGGLEAALRDYAAAFSREHAVCCELEADLEGATIAPEIETVIYRVTQEALANVAKHAHADHVDIRVLAGDEGAELWIDDDGSGFDPATLPALVREGHFGVIGMRERVETVGGSWELRSAEAAGTSVHAVLPSAPTALVVELPELALAS